MTDAATAQSLDDLVQVEADLREAATLYYLGRSNEAVVLHAARQYGIAQAAFLRAMGQEG